MARQNSPHIITLLDEVEKCEKEVVEALLALPDKKHVQVIINSGGGSVYASMGIATVMKMKQFQTEAVVLADCSSSALLVFAACQVRKVAPHASFLFHPMRWSSEDQSRLYGAQSWSSEFARISQITEDWLVEHLPISRRRLKSWIRHEKYVEAADLIRLGLAEAIEFPEENVISIHPKNGKKRTTRRQTASIRKVV